MSAEPPTSSSSASATGRTSPHATGTALPDSAMARELVRQQASFPRGVVDTNAQHHSLFRRPGPQLVSRHRLQPDAGTPHLSALTGGSGPPIRLRAARRPAASPSTIERSGTAWFKDSKFKKEGGDSGPSLLAATTPSLLVASGTRRVGLQSIGLASIPSQGPPSTQTQPSLRGSELQGTLHVQSSTASDSRAEPSRPEPEHHHGADVPAITSPSSPFVHTPRGYGNSKGVAGLRFREKQRQFQRLSSVALLQEPSVPKQAPKSAQEASMSLVREAEASAFGNSTSSRLTESAPASSSSEISTSPSLQPQQKEQHPPQQHLQQPPPHSHMDPRRSSRPIKRKADVLPDLQTRFKRNRDIERGIDELDSSSQSLSSLEKRADTLARHERQQRDRAARSRERMLQLAQRMEQEKSAQMEAMQDIRSLQTLIADLEQRLDEARRYHDSLIEQSKAMGETHEHTQLSFQRSMEDARVSRDAALEAQAQLLETAQAIRRREASREQASLVQRGVGNSCLDKFKWWFADFSDYTSVPTSVRCGTEYDSVDKSKRVLAPFARREGSVDRLLQQRQQSRTAAAEESQKQLLIPFSKHDDTILSSLASWHIIHSDPETVLSNALSLLTPNKPVCTDELVHGKCDSAACTLQHTNKNIDRDTILRPLAKLVKGERATKHILSVRNEPIGTAVKHLLLKIRQNAAAADADSLHVEFLSLLRAALKDASDKASDQEDTADADLRMLIAQHQEPGNAATDREERCANGCRYFACPSHLERVVTSDPTDVDAWIQLSRAVACGADWGADSTGEEDSFTALGRSGAEETCDKATVPGRGSEADSSTGLYTRAAVNVLQRAIEANTTDPRLWLELTTLCADPATFEKSIQACGCREPELWWRYAAVLALPDQRASLFQRLTMSVLTADDPTHFSWFKDRLEPSEQRTLASAILAASEEDVSRGCLGRAARRLHAATGCQVDIDGFEWTQALCLYDSAFEQDRARLAEAQLDGLLDERLMCCIWLALLYLLCFRQACPLFANGPSSRHAMMLHVSEPMVDTLFGTADLDDIVGDGRADQLRLLFELWEAALTRCPSEAHILLAALEPIAISPTSSESPSASLRLSLYRHACHTVVSNNPGPLARRRLAQAFQVLHMKAPPSAAPGLGSIADKLGKAMTMAHQAYTRALTFRRQDKFLECLQELHSGICSYFERSPVQDISITSAQKVHFRQHRRMFEHVLECKNSITGMWQLSLVVDSSAEDRLVAKEGVREGSASRDLYLWLCYVLFLRVASQLLGTLPERSRDRLDAAVAALLVEDVWAIVLESNPSDSDRLILCREYLIDTREAALDVDGGVEAMRRSVKAFAPAAGTPERQHELFLCQSQIANFAASLYPSDFREGLYESAFSSQPDNAYLCCMYAKDLLRRRQLKEAKRVVVRGLERNFGSSDLWKMCIQVYAAGQSAEQFTWVTQEAAKLFPGHARFAELAFTSLHTIKGNTDAAEELKKHALQGGLCHYETFAHLIQ